MKIKIFGILLLSVFAVMFLSGRGAVAEEDITEWNTGDVKPVSEADGTEGFGIDIGLKKPDDDASGETSDISAAKADLEGQEALDGEDTGRNG